MEYSQQSSPSSSSSSPSSRGSDVGSLRSPSDAELRHEGLEQVIQRLRYTENEHKKLLVERSRSMKDVNRKLQVHLLEVRGVREVNQKLMIEKDSLLKEKEELAGICCFLDDDRDKAKKVAREWQMFGRYATGVLQKELATCHQKIKELEQKQTSLLQENKTLKEICIMLDHENAGNRNSVDSQGGFPVTSNSLLHTPETRDSGDGSSNGSTASNYSPDHHSRSLTKENRPSPASLQSDSYLRQYDHRVLRQDEPKAMVKRITVPPSPPSSTHDYVFPEVLTNYASPPIHNMHPDRHRNHIRTSNVQGNEATNDKALSSQKPEAIVHAMKVLQLHEQLDTETTNNDYMLPNVNSTILDDKEKAMVREMCNVVWRKLGDKGKAKLGNNKSGLTKTASVSNL